MRNRAAETPPSRFVRRARPMLGTLVEIGIETGMRGGSGDPAIAAAFDRVAAVEARLSRFDPRSEVFRFNAAPAGTALVVSDDLRAVLAAARDLGEASGFAFDISLGTGAHGWRCDGDTLHKLDEGVTLDLGGIGKGYAVDRALETLRAGGIVAGWVNAGGDLRAFGPVDVPLDVRDEVEGGVRRFGLLRDGAFATSRLRGRQVSVAAETCLWADALTKLVAASGDAGLPLLERYGARAWLH